MSMDASHSRARNEDGFYRVGDARDMVDVKPNLKQGATDNGSGNSYQRLLVVPCLRTSPFKKR